MEQMGNVTFPIWGYSITEGNVKRKLPKVCVGAFLQAGVDYLTLLCSVCCQIDVVVLPNDRTYTRTVRLH